MSITKADADEILAQWQAGHADLTTTMSRLGVELEPDKPEPGFRINANGDVVIISDMGDHFVVDDSHYPVWDEQDEIGSELTPARVIPEAEYLGLLNYRDAAHAEADEADRLKAERDEWRDKYEALSEVENNRESLTAKPPVLTSTISILDEAQIQEDANVEWAAYRKDYGTNPTWTNVSHKAFHAGYRAALAKHGGARELPNLGDLEEAVMGDLCAGHWDRARSAGPKTVALLGGGDRGE